MTRSPSRVISGSFICCSGLGHGNPRWPLLVNVSTGLDWRTWDSIGGPPRLRKSAIGLEIRGEFEDLTPGRAPPSRPNLRASGPPHLSVFAVPYPPAISDSGGRPGGQPPQEIARQLPPRHGAAATARARPHPRRAAGATWPAPIPRVVGEAGRGVRPVRLRVAARPRRALPRPPARAARAAPLATRGGAGALNISRATLRLSPGSDRKSRVGGSIPPLGTIGLSGPVLSRPRPFADQQEPS
jgi:hypothetical protein